MIIIENNCRCLPISRNIYYMTNNMGIIAVCGDYCGLHRGYPPSICHCPKNFAMIVFEEYPTENMS